MPDTGDDRLALARELLLRRRALTAAEEACDADEVTLVVGSFRQGFRRHGHGVGRGPPAGGRDGAARAPICPVRVDAAINAGMVARAVELMPPDLPVFVLPMMPVGKSNEHHAYPGTLSLSHETLFRLWFEIGESVLRAAAGK